MRPALPTQQEFWNSPATRIWSAGHDRIDRVMAPITAALLATAAAQPGESVIDIGCGSGTTVLAFAAQVGLSGMVRGVDIAAPSVAKATERLSGTPQASVALADAQIFDFGAGSADLLVSRFGVMFFGDPVAAFANLRSALKPDGRLALAVFRAPAENPFASAPIAAIGPLLPKTEPLPPDAPGQFAWADPARVHAILGGAGFRDITLTPYDPPMRLGNDAIEAAAYSLSLGPAMRATLNMDEAGRTRVRMALQDFFRAHEASEGVVMQGGIWLVTARK